MNKVSQARFRVRRSIVGFYWLHSVTLAFLYNNAIFVYFVDPSKSRLPEERVVDIAVLALIGDRLI